MTVRSRRMVHRREVPYKLRIAILERDNFECQYCGKGVFAHQSGNIYDGDFQSAAQIDHVIPFSKGGLTIEENLKAACIGCNQSKKDKLVCAIAE